MRKQCSYIIHTLFEMRLLNCCLFLCSLNPTLGWIYEWNYASQSNSILLSGFMHWWGLTIDITSMNILIISVGLCVDFCAHIVHGFLAGKGTRHARVVFVMENIAPAVLNGGFSSMLALSLLVTSESHIFVSFFKERWKVF